MLNFKSMKSSAFKCVALMLLLLTVAMVGLVGCGEEELPTVSEVTMNTQPTKTQYEVGEKFDYTGAKLKVTYDDGTTAVIDVTASMIDLYAIDFSATGTKNITVTYTDENGTSKATVITVTVVDTLGTKKAEQIKAINDYTNLTDSAIVALKASYINAVNAAKNVDAVASIFTEYKAAVDAYTNASAALKNAKTAALAAIDAVSLDALPISKQNVAKNYKGMAKAAIELAGNTSEVDAIVNNYKNTVKDLADINDKYDTEVDAAIIELYTKVCILLHDYEVNESKFYAPDKWAEVVAVFDRAKATVLRADDYIFDSDENNNGTEDIIDGIIDEINKINNLLDDIYAAIVAYDEAATLTSGVYKFWMLKANAAGVGEYKDELDAIDALIDAIMTDDAYVDIRADLNDYDRKDTAEDDHIDLVAEYNARNDRYEALLVALAGADAVNDAILGIEAIERYVKMSELGFECDPTTYVTFASEAEFNAALVVINDWLVNNALIFKADGSYDVAASYDETGAVVDLNVYDMVEYFEAFEEAYAQLKGLEGSDTALSAIDIAGKLNAILAGCPADFTAYPAISDAFGIDPAYMEITVHIDDKAAMDALQAEIDAWCERYNLPESRILDLASYDAADIAAYRAYAEQRAHLNNMLKAQEEYSVENGVEDIMEAFFAKKVVFTMEYFEELYATIFYDPYTYEYSEFMLWGSKYEIDPCNLMFIMGEDFAAFETVLATVVDLYDAYENSVNVYADIQALITLVDGTVLLEHKTAIEAVTLAINTWATTYDLAADAENIANILNFGVIDYTVDPEQVLYVEDLYDDADAADIDSYVDIVNAYAALVADLQAKADAVNALIDAIGEVTLDSAPAIEAARNAFDAFMDEAADATATLTHSEIVNMFGLKESTLLAAEAKLVSLYINGLGAIAYTDLIANAIITLDVYFDWAGIADYTAIDAKNATVANETNRAYADVVRFPAYVEEFYRVYAAVNNTSVDGHVALYNIVHELNQLCTNFASLKEAIDVLPDDVSTLVLADYDKVTTATFHYSAFVQNNANNENPISPLLDADKAKYDASVDMMKQLRFKAAKEAAKNELQAQANVYTDPAAGIDPSTEKGSVSVKTIKNRVAAAIADLDTLVYNGEYELAGKVVTPLEMIEEYKRLALADMKDVYDSWMASNTPVVPGP